MSNDSHARGTCAPADHDRELPSTEGHPAFGVMDQVGDGLYLGDSYHEARAVAGTSDQGAVYADPAGSPQRVADDGLLGCNDCGQPLYYCVNDNWYHHVDPAQDCYLVEAEA